MLKKFNFLIILCVNQTISEKHTKRIFKKNKIIQFVLELYKLKH